MSVETHERSVALSVPIWSQAKGHPDREVVGVLGHVVGLGHFAELRPDERPGNDQMAVLVDGKPDFSGKKGSILEHPRLADWIKLHPETSADCYLGAGDVDDFERLRELRRRQVTSEDEIRATNERAWLENFRDPLGEDIDERWLAAIEPVVVHWRPDPSRDTGWGIIVQERHEAAVRPVSQLREGLLWRGKLALVVVAFVVTALWGFVVVVLNESNRFRWSFRRRRHMDRTGVGLSDSGDMSQRNGSLPLTAAERLTNRADDTHPRVG
jgi:hypothetical protein